MVRGYIKPEYDLGRDPLTSVYRDGDCYEVIDSEADVAVAEIRFQSGPYKDVGEVDGVFVEDLLVIVRDRLRQYQAGPFPDKNNERALEGIAIALGALNDRTRDRIAREVEGRAAE
jgi:hypothetical protein